MTAIVTALIVLVNDVLLIVVLAVPAAALWEALVFQGAENTEKSCRKAFKPGTSRSQRGFYSPVNILINIVQHPDPRSSNYHSSLLTYLFPNGEQFISFIHFKHKSHMSTLPPCSELWSYRSCNKHRQDKPDLKGCLYFFLLNPNHKL